MADPPDGGAVESLRAALRESEDQFIAFKAKTKKYVEKLKEQITEEKSKNEQDVDLKAELERLREEKRTADAGGCAACADLRCSAAEQDERARKVRRACWRASRYAAF
jgi:hypothetical protein